MALNAEVVGVCVSRMCGSERVEVTGTLLSSPFADIFVDVASESERDCDNPGVRKFTLDFFFTHRFPAGIEPAIFGIRLEIEREIRDRMGIWYEGAAFLSGSRNRREGRGEKVPPSRNRRFERCLRGIEPGTCNFGLLEGHVSTRDGDTLARLNRYRSPVG